MTDLVWRSPASVNPPALSSIARVHTRLSFDRHLWEKDQNKRPIGHVLFGSRPCVRVGVSSMAVGCNCWMQIAMGTFFESCVCTRLEREKEIISTLQRWTHREMEPENYGSSSPKNVFITKNHELTINRHLNSFCCCFHGIFYWHNELYGRGNAWQHAITIKHYFFEAFSHWQAR